MNDYKIVYEPIKNEEPIFRGVPSQALMTVFLGGVDILKLTKSQNELGLYNTSSWAIASLALDSRTVGSKVYVQSDRERNK